MILKERMARIDRGLARIRAAHERMRKTNEQMRKEAAKHAEWCASDDQRFQTKLAATWELVRKHKENL